MNRRTMLAPALALGLLAAGVAPAAAQSIWLDRKHRPSVLTEIEFPQFDDIETHFPTWTWFAAARLPLSQTGMIVFEIPYTRGETPNPFFDMSESAIGNPYLGVEIAPHPSGGRVELGIRLPLMAEGKEIPVATGTLTDVEREEAFIPDQLTVRISAHAHHAASAGAPIAWDLRFTPSAWIKTGDSYYGIGETELFFGYGGWLRYEARDVRVGGGFTGRWNATADGGNFGSQSLHQLDLAADFLHGPVRPGVQLKVPLDQDLKRAVDPEFGVSVMILPGQ